MIVFGSNEDFWLRVIRIVYNREWLGKPLHRRWIRPPETEDDVCMIEYLDRGSLPLIKKLLHKGWSVYIEYEEVPDYDWYPLWVELWSPDHNEYFAFDLGLLREIKRIKKEIAD